MKFLTKLATDYSFDGESASQEAYNSFKAGFKKAIELAQEAILQGDNFSEKISALLEE